MTATWTRHNELLLGKRWNFSTTLLFMIGAAPKECGQRSDEKISKNVDFSLWGNCATRFKITIFSTFSSLCKGFFIFPPNFKVCQRLWHSSTLKKHPIWKRPWGGMWIKTLFNMRSQPITPWSLQNSKIQISGTLTITTLDRCYEQSQSTVKDNPLLFLWDQI